MTTNKSSNMQFWRIWIVIALAYATIVFLLSDWLINWFFAGFIEAFALKGYLDECFEEALK